MCRPHMWDGGWDPGSQLADDCTENTGVDCTSGCAGIFHYTLCWFLAGHLAKLVPVSPQLIRKNVFTVVEGTCATKNALLKHRTLSDTNCLNLKYFILCLEEQMCD